MSSTEIKLSPTKKATKKSEQIVSSGETNLDEDNNDDDQLLINNLSETNKDCNVDDMEPLLIKNCADEFSTNPNNDSNCVQSQDDVATDSISGSGGFMKSNLSLNLNEILNEDKKIPKNKLFLESSDDQIINQIFFSTITVTPTTDDDILIPSQLLSTDNTPVNTDEVDENADMLIGPVDFFNRKIEEDDEASFTDIPVQSSDVNLCSLTDNFNCSFSLTGYDINVQKEDKLDPQSDALQLNEFVKRQQRPSIVIDCYDSDSNSKSDENVVIGEEKVNDYCFYFDQTIEEDDDDAYIDNGDDEIIKSDKGLLEIEDESPKKVDDYVDAVLEIQDESSQDKVEVLSNEGNDIEDDEEEDDDDSIENDEDIVNESCTSVNSALDCLESEITVVKKSVKTKKTTSKKKTVSTTESSSISSSKAESFEKSESNAIIEQHHIQKTQTIQQESITSNKSIEISSSGNDSVEAIQASDDISPVENGEKKKLTGKKKSKKSKKGEHEKENISVTTSTISLPLSHTQKLQCNHSNVKIEDECENNDIPNNNLSSRKCIVSSSLLPYEDDLSRIDVKSLKQKYSHAIEKQSRKSSLTTGINYKGLLSKEISVKNMCRSFGDLTMLNNEKYSSHNFQHVYKSSFSKFDALQKKNLRNGDGETNGQSPELEKKCHACLKAVFQMEQIKAEKKFWHKNCFRCSESECGKQLTVDTYQSHAGILYCKPHFKSLFSPKAVEESNEPVKPRKLEMIIRESQPIELPPDVVRSSDKTDLGLEELQQLNVRQRFQVFENASQQETKHELDKSTSVKRSTSILSKLARFQAKGMDVGVVDDSLNGVCYEHSSSEEEEEIDEDENQEDIELIRAKRAQKEKPMQFKEMHDIKSKFESGQYQQKEERREERKQELQNIRSRLFMGKQAKIKEMYQQAVADSEQTITAASKKSEIDISDKAKSIKERFEKGEIFEEGDNKSAFRDEEMSVFEQGIGKQSRSLFLELDATASRSPIQQSPSAANIGRLTPRQMSQTVVSTDDIVRSDSKVEDVQIENADIVSKFKFFETYKPSEKEKKKFRITPPRELQDGVAKLPSPDFDVYRDPHIARNDVKTEQNEMLELAESSQTASKMLSIFRQLESEKQDQRPVGPKPLKRFTPPPDGERRLTPNDDSGPEYSDSDEEEEECEEEEEEEEEERPNYVKSSHKNVDEFLKAAQSAERAKQLREKFEKWEKNEIKKEMNNSSVNLYEETIDDGQMETAKSLRARFEQMQQEEPKLPPTNTRIKVNRFV